MHRPWSGLCPATFVLCCQIYFCVIVSAAAPSEALSLQAPVVPFSNSNQKPDGRPSKPKAVKITPVRVAQLQRRKEIPSEAVSAEGLIRLDATVTDQAGKAVAGLQRADFRLLDNGQLQKIVAFRASQGLPASADDSLTVIILLDTLNLPLNMAAFERQQVAQFLRQKSGKLAQPITIYSLEDSGFFLIAESSNDREALATVVASDNKIDAYFLAPHVHSPLKAVVDTSLDSGTALAGLRALGTIATREVARPGKKAALLDRTRSR